MSEPLWSKGASPGGVDPKVADYLSGDDCRLDRFLFLFDIQASQAHVRGLQRIALLPEDEAAELVAALGILADDYRRGAFQLAPPHEDGHSAIEHWLTERCGDVGRKVHAGRSRNDQVQTALRLYLRDRLDRLTVACRQIAEVCLTAAEGGPTPMPGYTHLQRAVPSTLEHWFAGFAESYIDLAVWTRATRGWLNISPLGTAAGFGVNLPLDRAGVAAELGFERLQVNPQYVQNSRGRFEFQALTCLAQATLELRRLAWDVSLFNTAEFAFVRVPSAFTTGSSIMPNKRNPDLIELMRAEHAVVHGALAEIQSVLSLPSGYQRDLQRTKGATIRAFESGLQALELVPGLLRELEFDRGRMRQAITPELFATDVAIDRVRRSGIPFRDAYRQPIREDELTGRTAEESLRDRVSYGACGQLGLDELRRRLAALA